MTASRVQYAPARAKRARGGSVGQATGRNAAWNGRITTVKRLSQALSHKRVIAGVNASVVKSAVDHDLLTLEEVHRFIPKSTFARKVRKGSALSVEEGDRLARLARLKAYAAEVFDSAEDAEIWLNEKNPSLGGEAPIALLLTDDGARRVETILRRIDYGDYS